MNYVLFVGVVIGLLVIVTVPPVMTAAVNASIQGNSSDSSSNGTNDPGIIQPGQAYVIFDQATRHINEAQSALQNGDTESANNHLELAKQSLFPPHTAGQEKFVNPDIAKKHQNQP